jgi:hypothetical protein
MTSGLLKHTELSGEDSTQSCLPSACLSTLAALPNTTQENHPRGAVEWKVRKCLNNRLRYPIFIFVDMLHWPEFISFTYFFQLQGFAIALGEAYSLVDPAYNTGQDCCFFRNKLTTLEASTQVRIRHAAPPTGLLAFGCFAAGDSVNIGARCSRSSWKKTRYEPFRLTSSSWR